MNITATEIKALTAGGVDVYDKAFTVPAYAEVRAAVNQYIKHRKQIDDYIKSLIPDYVETITPGNPEKNDCDNRALRMWSFLSGRGWPDGFIAIPGHGICGVICEKNGSVKWRYFEPLDGADIDQDVEHLKTYVM